MHFNERNGTSLSYKRSATSMPPMSFAHDYTSGFLATQSESFSCSYRVISIGIFGHDKNSATHQD